MPPSTVTIRAARPDDAARLLELIAHGRVGADGDAAPPGGDEVAGARAALVEIAADPTPSIVLVAEVDGAVVGTCQVIVFRHIQHAGGWCAEIESMHVHPDQRGSGIGGLLIEAACEHAAAARCYRIQLTSNVARPDAHRFYERHGFTRSHVGFKRLL